MGKYFYFFHSSQPWQTKMLLAACASRLTQALHLGWSLSHSSTGKDFFFFLFLAPAVTEQSIAVAYQGRPVQHTGLATGLFPMLSKLSVGKSIDFQQFSALVAYPGYRIWLWPLWFGFFCHVASLLEYIIFTNVVSSKQGLLLLYSPSRSSLPVLVRTVVV